MCRRPLRGGTNSSTSSVNSSSATLSPFLAADMASVAAISAANSRLVRLAEPKAGRRGNIHSQHGGQFALLAEAFHERAAEAMRDVPVNVAHVVAGDVFAQFLEIHAAPLEMAQIRADHRVVHEAVRAHFHAADGFEQFSEGHGRGNSSIVLPS